MRIAQIAPGHDVTLRGSGDSVTSAKLKTYCEQALRFAAMVMAVGGDLTISLSLRSSDDLQVLDRLV